MVEFTCFVLPNKEDYRSRHATPIYALLIRISKPQSQLLRLSEVSFRTWDNDLLLTLHFAFLQKLGQRVRQRVLRLQQLATSTLITQTSVATHKYSLIPLIPPQLPPHQQILLKLLTNPNPAATKNPSTKPNPPPTKPPNIKPCVSTAPPPSPAAANPTPAPSDTPAPPSPAGDEASSPLQTAAPPLTAAP